MNRVALDLGFIQIYWYSICIVVGMAIGMFFVYREALKKGFSDNFLTNMIFDTVIVSIIGARLYYVAFQWGYYSNHLLDIFEIWNGGLAIHGAILFGGTFLVFYTRKRGYNTLKIFDICCVGLIIGQAIGRWGNFFNQEAFGSEVSVDFLKSIFLPSFIVDGMNINGAYYHPVFLYESLWCIIGFIVLLVIRRKRFIKIGQVFSIYCMWYAFGRFFFEMLRMDSLMLGPFKIAQLVSIVMFSVGLYIYLKQRKDIGKENLYNEEELQKFIN
jgi:phosphatidylglycerol:prolipoprotein diacylglycerol transferase